MRTFFLNTGKSPFLFDQVFTDYIFEIRSRALRLRLVVARLAGDYVGDDRPSLAGERSELSTWFVEQFDVLVEKFRPFLALAGNTATHLPRPPG
jgi:hypothetical protein